MRTVACETRSWLDGSSTARKALPGVIIAGVGAQVIAGVGWKELGNPV
jgi:hypothetical protein